MALNLVSFQFSKMSIPPNILPTVSLLGPVSAEDRRTRSMGKLSSFKLSMFKRTGTVAPAPLPQPASAVQLQRSRLHVSGTPRLRGSATMLSRGYASASSPRLPEAAQCRGVDRRRLTCFKSELLFDMREAWSEPGQALPAAKA